MRACLVLRPSQKFFYGLHFDAIKDQRHLCDIFPSKDQPYEPVSNQLVMRRLPTAGGIAIATRLEWSALDLSTTVSFLDQAPLLLCKWVTLKIMIWPI